MLQSPNLHNAQPANLYSARSSRAFKPLSERAPPALGHICRIHRPRRAVRQLSEVLPCRHWGGGGGQGRRGRRHLRQRGRERASARLILVPAPGVPNLDKADVRGGELRRGGLLLEPPPVALALLVFFVVYGRLRKRALEPLDGARACACACGL